MHPLVVSHLRYNRLQAAVNALGVSFEVMALLMLAGISRNLGDHPYAVSNDWLAHRIGDFVVCADCQHPLCAFKQVFPNKGREPRSSRS